MLLPATGVPQAGDLILAHVDSLGQHPGLQLPSGRRKQLFPGDQIVVAYGNRYASNQFEAVVPETLGPCHLAAGGGIAARVVSWHMKMKSPTEITPLALLADARGQRINLNQHALERLRCPPRTPPTIAVVGTGMDSGKTQSCAYLVRGLNAAGLRAGYAKITGTGAGGDTWLLRDAGADPVLDFTDAGLATTYLADTDLLEEVLESLIAHLAKAGVDAMVLEIADGVLQRETAALLQSATYGRLVHGTIMASQDSMGASAGVHWLRAHSRPPVVALSGIISAAPLQAREAVSALDLPVHDRAALATPRNALAILERGNARRGGRGREAAEALEDRENEHGTSDRRAREAAGSAAVETRAAAAANLAQ